MALVTCNLPLVTCKFSPDRQAEETGKGQEETEREGKDARGAHSEGQG
jgi:hypothetical protein